MIYCPGCKLEKERIEFHNNKSRPNGLSCYCKLCTSINNRQRRGLPESSIRQRSAFIKWKYGISQEEYLKLLKAQDFKCAICKTPHEEVRRPGNLKHDGVSYGLCIDHNHITNKVRGLLCNQCNRALRLFKDNLEFLQNAIEYLNTTGERDAS